MRNKAQDLKKIAEGLDITPTMYKNATDKYNAIANYMAKHGIDADFYPQGSFRTGTVVRPLKDGKASNYDLDVISELKNNKRDVSPSFIKHTVGNTLKGNEVYKSKLLPEDDRCWTLAYAEVENGVGFNLDVVPCVHEDKAVIETLINLKVDPMFANEAVSITDRKSAKDYDWLGSNPSGFGKWFDDINRPFLALVEKTQRSRIFTENRNLFALEAKIEDVPDGYLRSDLQVAIQLLKRHRDIHFLNGRNGRQLKPASVIITALTTEIARDAGPMGLLDLLKYVVNELVKYSVLLKGEKERNKLKFHYIDKHDGKWWITNPVDPDDNFADGWSDDDAKAFFRWINSVQFDAVQALPTEAGYITRLQTSFGKDYVNKKLNLNNNDDKQNRVSSISHPTKPWRKY